MSDGEFLILGKEILDKMQYMDAWSSESTNLSDKMKNLKLHMLSNPDNKYVQYFIEELMNRYIDLFFNKELMDAFHIPQPFYRQIQIYRNLPSTTHQSYGAYLFTLLELSSFPHFYPGFLEALQKYRPELAAHPHMQNLLTFTEQNQSIIHGSKDKYGTLEAEKELYLKAQRGESFKELEDFVSFEQMLSKEELRSQFMNKKEGNIGELYAFNLINPQLSKILVARDCKNGFGYDIYYYDNSSHVENLVEVKTTFRDIDTEDVFDLSENEFRVMQQCENNPLANYIVCRIKLDNSLNLISYAFLIMVDSTTFVDFASGIQYRREPNDRRISFRKCTPKVKIIAQQQ